MDEMVDTLISITFMVLHDKYSMRGNQDWVVELDSSTEGMYLSFGCAILPSLWTSSLISY